MNSTIELEKDIAYLKSVIESYRNKKNSTGSKELNADYQARLNFVIVQFKDIFRKF